MIFSVSRILYQRGIRYHLNFIRIPFNSCQISSLCQRRIERGSADSRIFPHIDFIRNIIGQLIINICIIIEPTSRLIIMGIQDIYFLRLLNIRTEHESTYDFYLRIFFFDGFIKAIIVFHVTKPYIFVSHLYIFERERGCMTILRSSLSVNGGRIAQRILDSIQSILNQIINPILFFPIITIPKQARHTGITNEHTIGINIFTKL